MATSDQVAYTNPLTGLLSSLLGGSTDTDTNKDVTQTDTGTSATTGNSTTTGTQNTTGTSGTTGTQTSTGTNNSTTQTNADTTDLQKVFDKQNAGITPDQLAAIFTEGSKATPGLITAYANATGSRSSNNSPLAGGLSDLMNKLTTSAATLNEQMLSDSGTTAANIANLTKGQTTTGTTGGTQTNDSTTNTNNNTTSTNNTASTNNTDTTSDSNQNTTQNVDATTGLPSDNLKLLAALGIGGSTLSSILGGGSGTALTNLLQSVTGTGANGTTSLLTTLKGLLNGGTNPGYQAGGNYVPTSSDLKALYGDTGYTGDLTVGSDAWYEELMSESGISSLPLTAGGDTSAIADLLGGDSGDDAASVLADLLGG